MIWRVLKKDLTRKRVLNCITLLFIIMCSMFASASANNVAAVTRGIDSYFDLAQVPDAVVHIKGETDALTEIRALPSVREVQENTYLCVFGSKYFRFQGKALDNFINPAYIYPEKGLPFRCFDEENRVIEQVPAGCFYATSPFTNDTDIREGDEVTLEVGDTKLTLKYLGLFKGALFNTADGFAPPRLLIPSADYDTLDREPMLHLYDKLHDKNYYVRTADPAELISYADSHENISVFTKNDYRTNFIYDMITAYIMMAISILLMITAFVVLRFAIGFTISEEFREIGVMKAVGIDNGSIRRLYIVKYLAIAAIGAAIGFFCSIPLGNLMLKTAVKNMVLSGTNSKVIGLLSSAAVVVIILLFCYTCTRRVRKLSPIDAVRNGQTGERFGRKSILRLGHSRLPSTVFLAANDILSSPKQFGIITAVFTLCVLLMIVLSCAAVTLKSEKLLPLVGIPSGEVHVLDTETLEKIFVKSDGYLDVISDTETLLKENGIPGACSLTISAEVELFRGDRKTATSVNAVKGHTEGAIEAYKGSTPQKEDEIMLTKSVMKALGAQIGDRITAQIGSRQCEFMVTGELNSFNSGAFLYRDFDFRDQLITGSMGLQIHFDGNPDEETIRSNIETLKELLESNKVYTSSELSAQLIGISDTLNAIKQLMMLLTVIVTAMIVILMERSLITKEKAEIAFMKASGISDGAIILQHTLRFVLTALLACLIAAVIGIPVSNAIVSWICGMPNVGDVTSITCDFDPVEVFVLCPAILLGVTAAGTFLTSLYTRKTKANDAASIE